MRVETQVKKGGSVNGNNPLLLVKTNSDCFQSLTCEWSHSELLMQDKNSEEPGSQEGN